jgi:hypothetical protein
MRKKKLRCGKDFFSFKMNQVKGDFHWTVRASQSISIHDPNSAFNRFIGGAAYILGLYWRLPVDFVVQ